MTNAYLDRVRETPLLSRWGNPAHKYQSQKLDRYLQPETYRAWGNTKLRWNNQLTGKLSKEHRAAFREWNDKVLSYKPHLEKIAEDAVAFLKVSEQRKAIYDDITWDLLLFLMEREYEQLVELNYYKRLFEVYEDGSFPCGLNRGDVFIVI